MSRWQPLAGYPLAALSLRPLGRHSLSVGEAAEQSAGRGATMVTARRKLAGQQGNEPLATAGWISPGCSLSPAARPAFFIRWRGSRTICRSGRHDGDGAAKATRVSKAMSRWQPLAGYPLAALSLRPLGRHSLSVGEAAEQSAGRGATMVTARRKLAGQQGNEPLATAGWISPGCSLSPAARPAFFIRWRGSRTICRSGRHDGDGAAKASGSARQ